jgi:aspartate aminotransferase
VKPLARYPAQMPPQGVRAIMEMAWRIPGAIHLEVGEPDFATPPHAIEAAVEAARNGWTKYTSGAGLPELRAALARKLKKYNGLDVTPDRVVATAGCVTAVATSLLALCDVGDEVLIPDPAWPNYNLWLRIQGAVPVPYPLRQEEDFLPDPAEVEKRITPRTKCLILNSPANPTGSVFPADLCRELVEMAQRHDLWLLSDEIYEHIVFEGKHTSPARFDRDGRVLTISGLSKGYAMTGWRIGYVVAPDPKVADILMRLQEPLTSCPVTVSQAAAIAAVDGPQDVVEDMRRAYLGRRDAVLAVLRRFNRYRYTPKGAFYVLIDIADTGWDSHRFARELLLREKVAVAPGSAFGAAGEGLVRVSLASDERQLLTGVERLCAFCEVLRKGEAPAAVDPVIPSVPAEASAMALSTQPAPDSCSPMPAKTATRSGRR